MAANVWNMKRRHGIQTGNIWIGLFLWKRTNRCEKNNTILSLLRMRYYNANTTRDPHNWPIEVGIVSFCSERRRWCIVNVILIDFCLFLSYKGKMRLIKVFFFRFQKWGREGINSNYSHLYTLYKCLNRSKYMLYETNT